MSDYQTWLLAQTERNDPIGDIARDVAEDVRSGCLPPFDTWKDVRAHILMRHGAIPDAVEALYSSWRAWLRVSKSTAPPLQEQRITCIAVSAKGKPCKRPPSAGSSYCWQHQ